MDDNYSNGRKQGGTKEPLDEYEEASERASLRLNITKTKIIAPSPITATQPHYCVANRREKMEIVTDFLFLGSKVAVVSDCSHEIRRQLLLGRKVMTNLNSMLKSRDITLLTKVHVVKAVIFPVVSYSCESWTVKKVECQRIDAFKLWC